MIGRLDDALLVGVAMGTLREEIEDGAEFRRYRFAEATRRGLAIDALDLDRALAARARERAEAREAAAPRARLRRRGGSGRMRVPRPPIRAGHPARPRRRLSPPARCHGTRPHGLRAPRGRRLRDDR
ncbi:MAG TPA: hypothetical protein VGC30_13905 [Dokdonella sp.]